MNWGIYIHEPDGDMGEGMIVGPVSSTSIAENRADELELPDDLEAIIVPLIPPSTANPNYIKNYFENWGDND